MSRRIVASFDREDRLLAAVTRARAKGIRVGDVHSPCPVHGLDEALGLRPTRLGIVCFALGATGASVAMAFQYWTHSSSWPLNVGGRPFNAWPAYLPVAFEVMVLMAGIGTVLAFLAVSRLFPGRRAELPGPRATDDLYIVVVPAEEGIVDTAAVLALFRAEGAVAVEERNDAPPRPARAGGGRALVGGLAAAFAAVLLGSWWFVADPRRPNDKILAEMADPVSYPSYSSHPDLPGGTVMQPPQPGTIARGRAPLHFVKTPEDAERAGRELASPLTAADAGALRRGAAVYANYCAVCHGAGGQGDGPVTQRGVPPPPSLTAANAMGLPPGRMFHIITVGQGNMPAHAGQILETDRWAAVLHVLNLQQRR